MTSSSRTLHSVAKLCSISTEWMAQLRDPVCDQITAGDRGVSRVRSGRYRGDILRSGPYGALSYRRYDDAPRYPDTAWVWWDVVWLP